MIIKTDGNLLQLVRSNVKKNPKTICFTFTSKARKTQQEENIAVSSHDALRKQKILIVTVS